MNININLQDAKSVKTFGGESKCSDGFDDFYGIQIDDVSIEISPEMAVELYNLLGRHLDANGHDLL